MVTLIILSVDLTEVEVFQQGKEEDVLSILRGWTIASTNAEDDEADNIRKRSFKDLDKYANGYHWGYLDVKRVHVLSTAEDRTEGWRTIV